MTDHDDFAFEPMPGLPALPPAGEEVLWQGRPDTLALASAAYGLRWIAVYFALVILWRAVTGFGIGGAPAALAYGLPYMILGTLACALVLLLAWVQARATVYTITSSRVAMRIGAALTVTLNLPFAQVGAAALELRRDGTGTIALDTIGGTRLSYLVCWPHVRPWHVRRVQPALRCIPEAEKVAAILAEAAEARISIPVVSRAAPMHPALAAE